MYTTTCTYTYRYTPEYKKDTKNEVALFPPPASHFEPQYVVITMKLKNNVVLEPGTSKNSGEHQSH
jgi:hypothetical protein